MLQQPGGGGEEAQAAAVQGVVELVSWLGRWRYGQRQQHNARVLRLPPLPPRRAHRSQ